MCSSRPRYDVSDCKQVSALRFFDHLVVRNLAFSWSPPLNIFVQSFVLTIRELSAPFFSVFYLCENASMLAVYSNQGLVMLRNFLPIDNGLIRSCFAGDSRFTPYIQPRAVVVVFLNTLAAEKWPNSLTVSLNTYHLLLGDICDVKITNWLVHYTCPMLCTALNIMHCRSRAKRSRYGRQSQQILVNKHL